MSFDAPGAVPAVRNSTSDVSRSLSSGNCLSTSAANSANETGRNIGRMTWCHATIAVTKPHAASRLPRTEPLRHSSQSAASALPNPTAATIANRERPRVNTASRT